MKGDSLQRSNNLMEKFSNRQVGKALPSCLFISKFGKCLFTLSTCQKLNITSGHRTCNFSSKITSGFQPAVFCHIKTGSLKILSGNLLVCGYYIHIICTEVEYYLTRIFLRKIQFFSPQY
jgi:hypothetical protein